MGFLNNFHEGGKFFTVLKSTKIYEINIVKFFFMLYERVLYGEANVFRELLLNQLVIMLDSIPEFCNFILFLLYGILKAFCFHVLV